LNKLQEDLLREIANIGTGHAASALSQLVSQVVHVSVPKAEIVPFEELPTYFGDPETPVCAILATCMTNLNIHLVLILSEEDSFQLSDLLMGQIPPPSDPDAYEAVVESALTEAGNIILGAFLSALGDFLNIDLHLEAPSIAFDMLGSILDIMISIFGEVGDTAFVLNTSLSFPDLEHQRTFTGKILMVPAPGTFEKIFSIMGVS